MEKAGEKLETLLATNDLQGAWRTLKAWYKHSCGRAPRPTREDLAKVSAEYAALYTAEPCQGQPVPILVAPVSVNDEIPTEEEIEEAVTRQKTKKAAGPSGMRSEHFKRFLAMARREEDPDDSAWRKLVALIQHVFDSGKVPQAMLWSVLVLIPKGDGGQRGIGLLETAWKLCTSIIDRRLKAKIQFHDALHGFRAKRGTGTACLEAKMRMQLSAFQGTPLFQIFIDLRKAYDTLDRTRTMEILKGYGVGDRLVQLLDNYWRDQLVVARQSGFHGDPFTVTRGVTQGDIVSPTIFNIVTDAVVRAWLQRCSQITDIDGSMLDISAGFYADDGVLAASSSLGLQQALEVAVELFERVGLKTNATKTKAMISYKVPRVNRESTPAYK